MHRCQNCGSPVPADQQMYKVNIKTGSGQGWKWHQQSSYYSDRLVCSSCKSGIDYDRKFTFYFRLVLFLVIAFTIYQCSQRKETPAIGQEKKQSFSTVKGKIKRKLSHFRKSKNHKIDTTRVQIDTLNTH